MRLRNPIIWLLRFRHRNGYGVHSPFAYNLLTEAIYNDGEYYAFETLDQCYAPYNKILASRRYQISRLLFRLVNYWQPKRAMLIEASEIDALYMKAATKKADFIEENSSEKAEFIYVAKTPNPEFKNAIDENTMLVVDHLRQNKTLWKELKESEHTRVTFDLYDIGIAFFNPKQKKQDYTVNF